MSEDDKKELTTIIFKEAYLKRMYNLLIKSETTANKLS